MRPALGAARCAATRLCRPRIAAAGRLPDRGGSTRPPAMIEGGSIPRLGLGMKLREDAARGRWVVMAPERMFVPDEIGLEVLRLIDGARSVDAIIDDLAARFAAPRAEITGDVLALLEELAGKGVVRA